MTALRARWRRLVPLAVLVLVVTAVTWVQAHRPAAPDAPQVIG